MYVSWEYLTIKLRGNLYIRKYSIVNLQIIILHLSSVHITIIWIKIIKHQNNYLATCDVTKFKQQMLVSFYTTHKLVIYVKYNSADGQFKHY